MTAAASASVVGGDSDSVVAPAGLFGKSCSGESAPSGFDESERGVASGETVGMEKQPHMMVDEDDGSVDSLAFGEMPCVEVPGNNGGSSDSPAFGEMRGADSAGASDLGERSDFERASFGSWSGSDALLSGWGNNSDSTRPVA